MVWVNFVCFQGSVFEASSLYLTQVRPSVDPTASSTVLSVHSLYTAPLADISLRQSAHIQTRYQVEKR